MTDKRVHTDHSAMKQMRPGAETDALSEASCHSDYSKVMDEEKKTHMHMAISWGRQNYWVHCHSSCDWLTSWLPSRPRLHFIPLEFPSLVLVWHMNGNSKWQTILYSRMAPRFLWSWEEGKTADGATVTSPTVPLSLPLFSFISPSQEVRFTMSSCFLRTLWSW